MIYTGLTIRAMGIAYTAHEMQVDKGGAPYIFHPFSVAEKMETEKETIVALLHDVVEDSEFTLYDLRNMGFSTEVVAAVDAITKRKGEEYRNYLIRVKANELARKVKIADLEHNSDLSRLCRPVVQKDMERVERYHWAKWYLEQ